MRCRGVLDMMKEQFDFKHFTICQSRCAMKVGTDGVLLGAWAQGGRRVMDVGTGTGLIALMMAERFPEAQVTAIDIDEDACGQAGDNVSASPYAARVEVLNRSLQQFAVRGDAYGDERIVFDAIVSNPPYFSDSLKNPDQKRLMARHTDTLPYRDLFAGVKRLLAEDGVFSMIAPSTELDHVLTESYLKGFSIVRQYAVRTTPDKQPKRYLLAFSPEHPAAVDIRTVNLTERDGSRSEWYRNLTDNFYLR